MDVFSQARCRLKSKRALLGNPFSDFVSTVPGRIPSVLKVVQCNHSRYCQFAALGVLPNKKRVSFWYHSVLHGCILQEGKAKRFPLIFCPLHLQNYEQTKEIYAGIGAIVPVTSSEYWTDLPCRLLLKLSKIEYGFHPYL